MAALPVGVNSDSQDQAVKVGNPMIYNLPTPASYGTGNQTYLTADIIGGIIVHDGTGGANGTLPSATLLAAAIPGPGIRVGDCIECLIVNGGTGTITLLAGTGVTFDTNQKAGSQIISANTSKYITCRFTSATAYVVYS